MDIKVSKPTMDPCVTISSEFGTVTIRPAELPSAGILVLNVTTIHGDVVIEER